MPTILRLLDNRAARFAAAMLSGVLLAFVLGLHPVWWVAWIAPIPLLAAVLRASRGETWALGYLAGVLGLAGGFPYLATLTGPFRAALFTALDALIWAFLVACFRSVAGRTNHWLSPFAYPALWAGLETLRSAVSPHSSWGSQAYGQMDALPVIQVASLAGPAGVTFLVCLFASTVAIAVAKGRTIRRPRLAYGLPALVLVAAIGWGTWRVSAHSPAATVQVGMAAIDDYVGANRGSLSESVWNRYAAATRELAQRGARVVVLPEMIATLVPDAVQRTRAMLLATARENQVSLLAGVGVTGAGLHNRAWLFSPRGEPLAEYDKRHLVPGFEAHIAPGHTPLAVPLDGRLYGIAICKDMHFPSLGRDNGALHVAAMLVPAWDFDVDGWYAARLTALRGVENGFTVIRSSKHGLLSVSDPYGRFLAETRSRRLPGATLLASAPVEAPARTLYTSIGDLFGWLCMAAAAAAYVASLRKRRA